MSLLPTLQRATDRVIDALMRVVYAVGPFGNDPASPTTPAEHARALLNHLSLLVIRLIRVSNGFLPTPHRPPTGAPAEPGRRASPTPRAIPRRSIRLPRRPGWLLAAMPDAAPALAAELHAALADPALLPLLAAVPTLARTLRPVLNALGLDALDLDVPPAPNDPPSDPRPPGPPATPLPPASPPTASHPHPVISPGPLTGLSRPTLSHAHFVTI